MMKSATLSLVLASLLVTSCLTMMPHPAVAKDSGSTDMLPGASEDGNGPPDQNDGHRPPPPPRDKGHRPPPPPPEGKDGNPPPPPPEGDDGNPPPPPPPPAINERGPGK